MGLDFRGKGGIGIEEADNLGMRPFFSVSQESEF